MRFPAACLFALALLVPTHVQGEDAEQAGAWGRLENGLQYRVVPVNPEAKGVVLVLFDVGHHHDPLGRSGLTHLVEHLHVTAGVPGTPARTASAFMKAYPHGWNAQTGDDYVVIATVFDAERLEAEIAEAALRMSALEITDELVAREKQRVIEEVTNMYDGFPVLAARNRAREARFPSPGQGRRGGAPAEVAALTPDQARAWWQRHFRPRNARVVVLAPGGSGPAVAAVRKCFAGIGAGEAPPPRVERPTTTEAGLVKKQVPRLHERARDILAVAYGMPRPGETEYAAGLILAARLQRAFAPEIAAVHRARDPFRPPPLTYALLDDPGVLTLAQPLADTRAETIDAARKALASRIGAVVRAPLGDADRALPAKVFGALLGLGPFAERLRTLNPYGAAFASALFHRAQLTPKHLQQQLDALSPEAYAEFAVRWLDEENRAAVVIALQ